MNIPLSNISMTELEINYAKEAIESGWISSSGKYVGRFERALASKIGRKHVVAVLNGTTALELALRAFGIGAGDQVIVPALTFVAPAAAVRTVGAVPVFADITRENWTIDPEEVGRLITDKTKAIVAVDVLGHPADYDSLLAFGLPIIEDAAEAHGACYRGKPVGGFGVVSVFSFFANKTISTGEGGCAATEDDDLADRMRLIAYHGMTKERPYWHDVVGHNFGMTNIAAAIGLGQVERWDELVSARKLVAQEYDQWLREAPIQRRPVSSWAAEACWLYTVATSERAHVLAVLRNAGIDARAIWTALPALPLYADSVRGACPVAREISGTAFWLPTWAHMPASDIQCVAMVLREALGSHTSLAHGAAS